MTKAKHGLHASALTHMMELVIKQGSAHNAIIGPERKVSSHNLTADPASKNTCAVMMTLLLVTEMAHRREGASSQIELSPAAAASSSSRFLRTTFIEGNMPGSTLMHIASTGSWLVNAGGNGKQGRAGTKWSSESSSGRTGCFRAQMKLKMSPKAKTSIAEPSEAGAA